MSLSFFLDCDFSVEIAQLNMSISTGIRLIPLASTHFNEPAADYLYYVLRGERIDPRPLAGSHPIHFCAIMVCLTGHCNHSFIRKASRV